MTDLLSKFGIGRVAPLTLALFLLADGLSRFVPIDFFAFRAWETVILDPAPTGPFAPNRSWRNFWSYGDLASLGNLPRFREYRDEAFTTDAYGFRNPPQLAAGQQKLSALLLGDSFGAGSGSSDHETLPAQLGELLGAPVYNLSGGPLAKLADIRGVAKRLNFDRGVLIYEIFERDGPPPINPPGEARFAQQVLGVQPSLQERLVARYENLKISRADIQMAIWKKALLAWYRGEKAAPPNDSVVVGELVDGTPMLLFRIEGYVVSSLRPMASDYFLWLARELEKDGISLLVVLVPSKYTVYHAHLKPTGLPRPTTIPLARLEAELTAGGVGVVNLTQPFIERASSDFARGEVLYWRDDTHWNPRGIRVAAEEIRKKLRPGP